MSFWVSVRGRKVVRVLAAVGVSGAFLRFYLPNTHYLHNIREVTQLYRRGEAAPLPVSVTKLIHQVQHDLNQQTQNYSQPPEEDFKPQSHDQHQVNEKDLNQQSPNSNQSQNQDFKPQTHNHAQDGHNQPQQDLHEQTHNCSEPQNDGNNQQTLCHSRHLTTYTVYGFDLFHAGSLKLGHLWGGEKYGAIIGVPLNFAITREEDFDTSGIVINNQPVPWSTPAGQSLKQSLVLSPKAKKFALCRELVAVDSNEPILLGTFAASTVSLVYLLASGVNRAQNFYARPRALRVTWYGLVGAFGAAMWALLKDSSTVNHEISADERAASLSPSYAEGGLEFYEKILQRNTALRQLMGKEGEKMYTVFGNDQVLIRTRHQPYTLRRDYMKNLVEKQSKNE